ncbi:hypothetical protein BHE90_002126 [Fusarium euwallaceae]|uniref:Uncharacterized protein n=1 Tax=Fusarium euwallaceae TaxID=1147111 RepID=A0A430M5R3_9HYPO|nr:hypothetical protein BHE90_002126 [Fusarium euwallaceae]
MALAHWAQAGDFDEDLILEQLARNGVFLADECLDKLRNSLWWVGEAQDGDFDEDLILKQLARNRVFLTDESLGKLRNSLIIVVDCGVVGSRGST